MYTLSAAHTQEDLHTLRDVYRHLWDTVPPQAWNQPTGERPKDWTMHQTLAHVVAVAQTFNRAVEQTLGGEAFAIEGMTAREQLGDWNTREIARLGALPPRTLAALLDAEFTRAIGFIEPVMANAAQTVVVPVYNRAAPLPNLLAWQLSHGGIIHAAQLMRPLAQPPLWEQYPLEMQQRQVSRFLLNFSWAYWQQANPADFVAVVEMHISGEHGGTWQLIAAGDGGDVHMGSAQTPTVRLVFNAPKTLFEMFTASLNLRDALKQGALRFEGMGMSDAMNLLRYFSPSPPRD